MENQPADPIRDSGTRRSKSPDVRVQSISANHQNVKAWQGWGRPCTTVERNQPAEGRFVTPSGLMTLPLPVVQTLECGRSHNGIA